MINIHNKLVGVVPMTYNAVGAAVVGAVAAVAGAGYSVYSGEEAKKTADFYAKKQEADIAAQEKLIAEEQRKQDKVAAERDQRLKTNELLSGSEVGVADTNPNSLLT